MKTQQLLALGLATLSSAITHPGLLHNSADFTRIKSLVAGGEEPWKTGWANLVAHVNHDYTPSPQTSVCRGSNAGCTENYASLFRDASAAYVHAIHWKVTGDTASGDTAATILDAWSSTLEEITGSSDKFLAAGIYGYEMANAAEILRAYSGWDGLTDFVAMLTGIFYPLNHDFLENHNGAAIDHYWANWDLCNLCSVLAIGVVADDNDMIDEALDYFSNGEGNGQLENAIWALYKEDGSNKVLGQGQEEGRDQGHSGFDYALLGVFAQQGYNQGHDIFAIINNRILAGMEYFSKYNVGEDVPYTTYTNSDVTQDVISSSSRGNIRPMGELLYAHYDGIRGLNASWTGKYRDMVLADGNGAEGGGSDYGTTSGAYDQLGFGTILYRLDA